jgi:hypothetical protein
MRFKSGVPAKPAEAVIDMLCRQEFVETVDSMESAEAAVAMATGFCLGKQLVMIIEPDRPAA